MNLLVVFLMGLVFGSFVGAFTYRLPRSKSIVKGRSVCDNCGLRIAWYANIPVFSFLFLKGRSLCCGKKISLRYPIIEFSTALFFVFLYLNLYQNLLLFFVYCLLFLLTLSVFIIDFEHQIIPDELILLLFFVSLFFLFENTNFFYEKIFAGFLFSLFLLLIHLFTQGRGMGLGDVKFTIPIGIILGLEKGVYWMLASFLTGGFIASILLVIGKAKLKQKIAFGPFLVVGFWLLYFFL